MFLFIQQDCGPRLGLHYYSSLSQCHSNQTASSLQYFAKCRVAAPERPVLVSTKTSHSPNSRPLGLNRVTLRLIILGQLKLLSRHSCKCGSSISSLEVLTGVHLKQLVCWSSLVYPFLCRLIGLLSAYGSLVNGSLARKMGHQFLKRVTNTNVISMTRLCLCMSCIIGIFG